MLDIEKLLPLISEMKERYRLRIIFSPRSTLASRTGLKKAGENKFTIEYNPDLCNTDDAAYEIFRSAQLCDKSWIMLIPTSTNQLDKSVNTVTLKLQTVLFEPWIKEQMQQKKFNYGGYIQDYFTVMTENFKRKIQSYEDIEDKQFLFMCAALDYSLFLMNKDVFPQTFIDDFATTYYNSNPRAVEIGETIIKVLLENKAETFLGAEKSFPLLINILGLQRDATSLKESTFKKYR